MKGFYEQMEQAKASSYIDAFIQVVNADHDDVISIPRNVACLMRDEITRLRKKAKELQ